jgi:hypothetical protein
MWVKLAELCALATMIPTAALAQDRPTAAVVHDGAHDFDFLIGDWKAHVKRLPDRLVGSTRWVEYDGISNHHKLLDTNANLEQFEVDGPAGHMKGQTLRMYDPDTKQWSLYLLDLDHGSLGLPPVVGGFEGKRGTFYDHEEWKGRPIKVRYLWLDLGPQAARMEQAFSTDEGKTWETNWICELSR